MDQGPVQNVDLARSLETTLGHVGPQSANGNNGTAFTMNRSRSWLTQWEPS